MAVYLRVYDSRHLQADCKEPGSARNPSLSNRTWATFFTFCPRGSGKQKCPVWLTPHAWPRSVAAVGVTLYTLGFKSAYSCPRKRWFGWNSTSVTLNCDLDFYFNVGELGLWFVRIQSIKVRGQAVQQSIGNRRTRPIVLPYAADVAGNDLLKMKARHHCQPVGLGLASQTAVFCDVSWVFER